MKNSFKYNIEYLLFFQISLLVISFFYTPNPYLADHSGFGKSEDSFALNTGIIAAILIFLAWVTGRSYSKKSDLAFLFIFISFFSFQLFYYGYPFSLAFPYLSLFGLQVFSRKKCIEPKWSSYFFPILTLFILSIFLAILRPGIWGNAWFRFSREQRGDLTFDNILGLSFFLTVLFVYKSRTKPAYIIYASIFSIFELSFGSRRNILIAIPGLFISIIFYFIKFRKKILVLYLSISILLIASGLFYFLFLNSILEYALSKSNGDISTGRFELWSYYWDLFLRHPLIGNGTRIDVPQYFAARTEVPGFLNTLTKFGLVFSIWQLYYIVKSTKISLRYIFDPNSGSTVFYGIVVAVGVPMYFIEGISMVTNPAGMIFWYSIFRIYYIDQKNRKVSSMKSPARK